MPTSATRSRKCAPGISPPGGLKDVTTGETLCDPDKVIILEKMVFPDPVIHVAVEPKTKADQEKMGVALHRLAQEDPSFRVHTDEDPARPSSPAWRAASGDHRRSHEARVRRGTNVGAPQVAYRRGHEEVGRAGRQIHPQSADAANTVT